MRLAIAFSLPVLISCGGSPTPGGGATATVQITSTGFSPAAVSVNSGTPVDFVNKDTASHQITSTDCAQLDSPVLTTGKDFSVALTGPKTCHFSDALNAGVAAFSGTITVAAPGY